MIRDVLIYVYTCLSFPMVGYYQYKFFVKVQYPSYPFQISMEEPATRHLYHTRQSQSTDDTIVKRTG